MDLYPAIIIYRPHDVLFIFINILFPFDIQVRVQNFGHWLVNIVRYYLYSINIYMIYRKQCLKLACRIIFHFKLHFNKTKITRPHKNSTTKVFYDEIIKGNVRKCHYFMLLE